MKEYFVIAYEKDKIIRQKEVEVEFLIINIIKLQDNGYKIENIRDSFCENHSLSDLIQIYKESLDVEYEDVETKTEAYNIAVDYFKYLYKNNQIDQKYYEQKIEKLKRYKEKIKDKDEFIEKVKELYVS